MIHYMLGDRLGAEDGSITKQTGFVEAIVNQILLKTVKCLPIHGAVSKVPVTL